MAIIGVVRVCEFKGRCLISFLFVTPILRRDRLASTYMESDGKAGNGCRNTLREDEETGETNKFVSEAVWGNSGTPNLRIKIRLFQDYEF
jgi:hypothetical protein